MIYTDLETYRAGQSAAQVFIESAQPLEAAQPRVYEAYKEFAGPSWMEHDGEGLLFFRMGFVVELAAQIERN